VNIPKGWKLVPEQPTDEMMDAGLYQASHDANWQDVYSSYIDMIAKAPEPPESSDP
jgi:hypothetical protein